MDRRKSIKALIVGSVSTGVLVEACKNEDKKGLEGGESKAEAVKEGAAPAINRMKEESEHEK